MQDHRELRRKKAGSQGNRDTVFRVYFRIFYGQTVIAFRINQLESFSLYLVPFYPGRILVWLYYLCRTVMMARQQE